MADLVERVPFLMLALDLPPAPLYKDALEKNIIPQARAAGRPPLFRSGCLAASAHLAVYKWLP